MTRIRIASESEFARSVISPGTKSYVRCGKSDGTLARTYPLGYASIDAEGIGGYRHEGEGDCSPASCELSFAEFLAAVENPDLRAVAEHWNHARGSKKMPAFSDIDPTAIGPQLPIIWSWKYDRETDLFTGRLAGDEIDAIFGKTMRGADMREFFKDSNYEAIFTRNRKVAVEPCLCHCKGLVLIHFGRHGYGERIVLPLAADGEHGDGVFGATVYHSMQRGLSEASKESEWTGEDVTFYGL